VAIGAHFQLYLSWILCGTVWVGCGRGATPLAAGPDASKGEPPRSNSAWSAWPLVNHDPANTRHSPNVGPQSPVELFALDVVPQMLVIGVDGTLYTTDWGQSSRVDAFDPRSGAQLWSFQPTAAVPTTVPPFSPSIAAGPEGNVYAAYRQGPFCALNRDGSVRWRFTTGKTSPTGDASQFGPPLVDFAGRVYVAETGVVYAFESNGRLAWRFDTRSVETVTPVGVAADGTVYVLEEAGPLHALARNGDVRWTLPVSASVPFFSTPIVRDDSTLLFAAIGDKSFGAVGAGGALLWQRPGSFASPFALGSDDAPYAADFLGVVRMDGTGSVVWHAAAGGRGTIVDGADTVYSTAPGVIDAVDSTGVVQWELSTTDPTMPGSSAVTPSIHAIGGDGTLYAGFGSRIHAIGGGGRCEGKPVDCDDHDPCTVDRCDPAAGCVHASKCASPGTCTTATCASDGTCSFAARLDGFACDDGIACSQGDACRSGQCAATGSTCSLSGAWPMAGHDPRHTSATPLLGPSAPTLKWSSTGAAVDAYVISDNGTIYATSAGQVRMFRPDGVETAFASVAATDLVLRQDGGLYAISPMGVLQSLDAAGTSQWMFGTAPLRAPSIGLSGALYSRTRFDLFALTPDGTTLWKIPTGGAVGPDAPAIGPDGTLYALCSDLWAVAPDGRVKWRREAGWARGLVVGSTGTVFVLLDGSVRAIDANGVDVWTWSSGDAATFAPALPPGGDLMLVAGSTIHRLDSSTGALRSSMTLPVAPTQGQVLTAPVVDGSGVLFVVSNSTDNSFQPLTQATLYAVDSTYRVLWSTAFPPAMGAGGANLAIGPGRTLYLTFNGALQAIAAP
jgi:outer membrane protein assembly factor BamB